MTANDYPRGEKVKRNVASLLQKQRGSDVASSTPNYPFGVLPRIPGTEEPGGLLSVGSHRVGHDWSDLAAAAASPYFTWRGPCLPGTCRLSLLWMLVFSISGAMLLPTGLFIHTFQLSFWAHHVSKPASPCVILTCKATSHSDLFSC